MYIAIRLLAKPVIPSALKVYDTLLLAIGLCPNPSD